MSLQLHEGQLFVEDMSTTEMSLLLMIVTHLTKMDLPTLEKWNKKDGTQPALFLIILFGLLVATHKQGNNWYSQHTVIIEYFNIKE